MEHGGSAKAKSCPLLRLATGKITTVTAKSMRPVLVNKTAIAPMGNCVVKGRVEMWAQMRETAVDVALLAQMACAVWEGLVIVLLV